MKRLILIIALVLMPSLSLAQNLGHFQNWCQYGAQQVTLQGLQSTNFVQGSFPNCAVTVYYTGTTNKAAIYSDNLALPTALANSYTANLDGSFGFYASTASIYDIVISGAYLPSPFTFSAVTLPALGSGSGGGLSGSGTAGTFPIWTNTAVLGNSRLSDIGPGSGINYAAANGDNWLLTKNGLTWQGSSGLDTLIQTETGGQLFLENNGGGDVQITANSANLQLISDGQAGLLGGTFGGFGSDARLYGGGGTSEGGNVAFFPGPSSALPGVVLVNGTYSFYFGTVTFANLHTLLPNSQVGTPQGALIRCTDCLGAQNGVSVGTVAAGGGTGTLVMYDGTAWRTVSGLGSAGAISFTGLTSGTNTTGAMLCGTGCSMGVTGAGTIGATTLLGGTWAIPGTVGSTTPNTGAFTTLAAVNLTVSGTCTGCTGSFVFPSAGIAVSPGTSGPWSASLAVPAGVLVGTTATQNLTNKSIAGSEINSGVIGATYGGTGLNTSASTGVAQVSSGTWSVSTALANGTTCTTQSPGDNSTNCGTTAYTDAMGALKLNINNSAPTGLFDASATTQLKLPVHVGFATVANGEIGYDSGFLNIHFWQNAADYIAFGGLTSGTFVNGDCAQISLSSSFLSIIDAGGACGTSSMVYPSGSGIPIVVSGTSWGTTLTETDGNMLAGVSGAWTKVTALPNGITATTQTALSADTKVATDNYVDRHFIASGSTALGTSSIASATCATVVTASATGTLTTDVVRAGFNGDPTATAGYIPSASGMLTIIAYPTANVVSFKVCNNSSGPITPGAVTINWQVIR